MQAIIPIRAIGSWFARLVLQALPWQEPWRSATREARDISHAAIGQFLEEIDEQ